MTIVELMVALIVVGILIAIVAPTASSYIARQELAGAGRTAVQVLRDARDAAMNESAPRYVLFDPDADTYQVYRFDGTDWVPATQARSLGGTVSFTDGDVTFPALSNHPQAGATVPENAAYFDTRGRYPSGYASSYSLTLRGGGGRTVVLTFYTATGEVTGL